MHALFLEYSNAINEDTDIPVEIHALIQQATAPAESAEKADAVIKLQALLRIASMKDSIAHVKTAYAILIHQVIRGFLGETPVYDATSFSQLLTLFHNTFVEMRGHDELHLLPRFITDLVTPSSSPISQLITCHLIIDNKLHQSPSHAHSFVNKVLMHFKSTLPETPSDPWVVAIAEKLSDIDAMPLTAEELNKTLAWLGFKLETYNKPYNYQSFTLFFNDFRQQLLTSLDALASADPAAQPLLRLTLSTDRTFATLNSFINWLSLVEYQPHAYDCLEALLMHMSTYALDSIQNDADPEKHTTKNAVRLFAKVFHDLFSSGYLSKNMAAFLQPIAITMQKNGNHALMPMLLDNLNTDIGPTTPLEQYQKHRAIIQLIFAMEWHIAPYPQHDNILTQLAYIKQQLTTLPTELPDEIQPIVAELTALLADVPNPDTTISKATINKAQLALRHWGYTDKTQMGVETEATEADAIEGAAAGAGGPAPRRGSASSGASGSTEPDSPPHSSTGETAESTSASGSSEDEAAAPASGTKLKPVAAATLAPVPTTTTSKAAAGAGQGGRHARMFPAKDAGTVARPAAAPKPPAKPASTTPVLDRMKPRMPFYNGEIGPHRDTSKHKEMYQWVMTTLEAMFEHYQTGFVKPKKSFFDKIKPEKAIIEHMVHMMCKALGLGEEVYMKFKVIKRADLYGSRCIFTAKYEGDFSIISQLINHHNVCYARSDWQTNNKTIKMETKFADIIEYLTIIENRFFNAFEQENSAINMACSG